MRKFLKILVGFFTRKKVPKPVARLAPKTLPGVGDNYGKTWRFKKGTPTGIYYEVGRNQKDIVTLCYYYGWHNRQFFSAIEANLCDLYDAAD